MKPSHMAITSRLLCILLLITGCGQSTPTTTFTLDSAFPGVDAIPGWTPDGGVTTYDSSTLYDLVNGQADAFFAYNFEQVAVRSYTSEDNVVRVEIWQLATPADAYGLFTRSRTGEPVDIGNEGDTDPGRRMIFWQNRYYVQVRGQQPLPNNTLQAFANAVSSALPTGGDIPTLLERLPQTDRVARSEVFFRQELSIQDDVWLGGENILGLNAETEGVLARYDLNGSGLYLIIVHYPDAGDASAALAALAGGTVGDLRIADANGAVLGAVFGPAAPEDAPGVRQLLDAALQ